MKELILHIEDSDYELLKQRAERLGISYEELFKPRIEEIINLPEDRVKELIKNSVRRHEKALKRLA